jgi:hypothetical protein
MNIMDQNDLLWVTSLIVLALWALAAVSGIITGDYEALQLITPIMLLLAGYIFGAEALRARRDRNGTNDK